MKINPFFVTFFILATIIGTLSPAIDASDVEDQEGNDGGFLWYLRQGSHGNKCQSNTWWGQSVCRLKTPGQTCCKDKCVNLKEDKTNCGSCGSVCGYNTQCCDGKCVNVVSNAYHCGGCNKKCPNKDNCHNSMCNYAS